MSDQFDWYLWNKIKNRLWVTEEKQLDTCFYLHKVVSVYLSKKVMKIYIRESECNSRWYFLNVADVWD